MIEYSPSRLPAVSCVEVVILRNIDPPRVTEFMKHSVIAPKVVVEGAKALQIAQVWRELAPGDMMRCHLPPFGLRFIADGKIICQASICWECNNAYGEIGEEPFGFEFDAEAVESKSLLAELRRIVGE